MTEVPISDADLQAFVDGRLDAKRRAEVEAYIAANPEAARTVDAYRAQNAALHAAFDGVLNEPLPEALAQSPVGSQWVTSGASPRRSPFWSWGARADGPSTNSSRRANGRLFH